MTSAGTNRVISPLENIPKEETLRLRDLHIGKNCTVFFRSSGALKIVRGEGQYMFDENGVAYLDCINNVAHVGHCHPSVVRAGSEQMSLLSTNSRYLHDNLVLYAKRIVAKFPDPLSIAYFVNSGSEANDLALRIAKAATGQKDLICLEGAYHGHLQSTVSISPYKFNRIKGYKQKKHVHVGPLPCEYRGKHQRSQLGPQANIGEMYADEIGQILRKIESEGRKPAAFICESLISCGGQVILPDNYLKTVYANVRAAGGLCIADEVQTGFGRVGSHFWAFELQGVVPDIVTVGKPIGNGHPLACVITTPKIARAFEAQGAEYFNTYGGNPVSMAIANAVLNVIEDERLQQHALNVGTYLIQALRKVQRRRSLIGDVRGIGLFVGIELVKDPQTKEPGAEEALYISRRFKEEHCLVSTEGEWNNVLKLKPPMVFTRDNVDTICTLLDTFLAELERGALSQRKNSTVESKVVPKSSAHAEMMRSTSKDARVM
ncbi:5-phosphohydroxy-L-lysine phospho-lyase-like [Varroa jacobsoni]|uniref:5-phosphohydroxy-L-lysine phospho-lyase-like n=1 Tax=Varroa jacobsoni TaxID=62625 RepID=UPI000BF66DDD|nr:5-phosphohydroxy-L-lysine phospho-lyase-like [Varroa jacobsoni]XP_022685691.1 5-phosphohydroxy-L-lysine phospho-lyase-like [Varroa jacobsoni]XP_022685692.1 5-phosphohydroxy-L-lysine phospho-lyase-like [Varroa jacobsoni]XP_022707458.1 5-phosphohydroxy-L-lysine phospho-lyase-like [Varroa jacobsoni]